MKMYVLDICTRNNASYRTMTFMYTLQNNSILLKPFISLIRSLVRNDSFAFI